jgi:anaerobic selenocysteine-containing dehydrogenase
MTSGKINIHQTACTLDCPDGCSLEVHVTDGRVTKITGVAGNNSNPFTDGWICAKTRGFDKRVYSPRRVLTPLIRTGTKGNGEFRPASWDEALDIVAERVKLTLQEKGGSGIAPILTNASSGTVSTVGLTPLLYEALGATDIQVVICGATQDAAWQLIFGNRRPSDPFAVRKAKLVVLWGVNPFVSNTHWVPHINAALKDGAKLIVVDPRKTSFAKRADVHLQPLPGTDVLVAFALTQLLEADGAFDDNHISSLEGGKEYIEHAHTFSLATSIAKSGVLLKDLQAAARCLAENAAFFKAGLSLEKSRNGGAALRSVYSLAALLNTLNKPGGGICHPTSAWNPVNLEKLRHAVLGDKIAKERPTLNINLLPEWLSGANSPVSFLFVQGANPAATNADQTGVEAALSREDLFTVVHEQVMTDTARFADVVLPAPTFLERDDSAAGWGVFGNQRVRAVIERVGESRSNDEVAAGLAVRLGFDAARFDPSFERLANLLEIPTEEGFHTTITNTDETFPIHLIAYDDGVDPLPTYRDLEADLPLTLISPANRHTINSIMGEDAPSLPRATLNEADALARGIKTGDEITVKGERSSLQAIAEVTSDIRPGVVMLPKGRWGYTSNDGKTTNALTVARLNDLAGGPCYNESRVDVSLLTKPLAS